ncbi:cytochrome c oxidase subunit II [Wenzhouxiangella sp. AB-CW3]|uniref:cytochrome c oxidase subunit II n=1 Tax=Wenzhouxiangella sp. AB-CW3 TaxID=2771012 RepID=UPI001CC2C883|nr:cytochrome c oxidase subunit II [Wenzhouxiangella sp. AB-CW3]
MSVLLGGCGGPMSALEPAGQGAADIAWITWAMLIGTGVFMLLMSAFWLHAVYRRDKRPLAIGTRFLLLGGGVVLPLIVITLLLVYGVRSGHSMLPIGEADLTVEVTAFQWYWEFEYPEVDGAQVVTTDELHLPVGQRIDFNILTADVIHSFWVPVLGGKVDAIPGRTNTLRLEPTHTGRFRGQCAEFCGALHAHMAFDVVVHEIEDFEDWLQEQAGAQR